MPSTVIYSSILSRVVPGNIRYNSAVFAQEGVHKARFTRIWTAYNNRRNTVANEASCVRCGQKFIHSFQNRLQLIANLLARYVLNILLRIVDGYL